MKKIIAGGFLMLSGMIGISSCYMIADRNLESTWEFSRYLTTIFQKGGIGFEFILSIAMVILGLALIFLNINHKDSD